jgi:hypothetical protein
MNILGLNAFHEVIKCKTGSNIEPVFQARPCDCGDLEAGPWWATPPSAVAFDGGPAAF